MTTRSSFEGQQRHSGADLPNTSSSYAGSSGRQSDDSAFYAFGDDWDKPPKMSSALAQFLHEKAAVPMEFINDFEQAALVWNMKSFMKWFSMGTTSDVAKRFGTDFCMKYPIQIARLSVLYQFLREHPLAISETDPNTPNYQSFDREEWWSFLQENRRDIKAEWDDAFDQLFQEATERITNRSSVAQPEYQFPLPRTPASNHPTPPPLTYSTGAGFATRDVIINRSPPVSEFVTREVNINRSPPVSNFATREVNINRSPPVSDFATREGTFNRPPPVSEIETQKVNTSPAFSPIPDNPAGFMDRIQRREIEKGNDRYDESTKIKRSFISTEIKPWNGNWESFPMLKNQIVAATLKAGMSHCTDDEVIRQYVTSGGGYNNHPRFP